MRLISAPRKLSFLIKPLNLIDLAAISPFYITLIVRWILGVAFENIETISDIRRILQIFRVLRILGVLKLARHSAGLKAVDHTFSQNYREFGLLAMFLSIGIISFATVGYYAEKDVNPEFSSIPAAFWWSIITMTTFNFVFCISYR